MNDKIFLDTRRLENNPVAVICYTNIFAAGENVRLDVMAFGKGREGTDRAFDKMEDVLKVLLGVKWQEVEIVRVY